MPRAARPKAAPPRPVLLVLAGVNGAGKSSIAGELMLRRAGLSWFNPDAYARLLVDAGMQQTPANARAWQHGVDLLDRALVAGHSHAFETTLGGTSIAQRIAAASATHDVLIWYCGLATAELHLERVLARVAAGGHDIAPAKIRERWVQAPLNLIRLLPCVSELKVFDNSQPAVSSLLEVAPRLVLHRASGQVRYPIATEDLMRTPQWAKPIVKAARDLVGHWPQ